MAIKRHSPESEVIVFGADDLAGGSRSLIIPLGRSYSEDNSPKLSLYEQGPDETVPFATLTVYMANSNLAEDEILVKAYGENEQIANALRDTPCFQDTGRRVSSGYAVAEVWRTNLLR